MKVWKQIGAVGISLAMFFSILSANQVYAEEPVYTDPNVQDETQMDETTGTGDTDTGDIVTDETDSDPEQPVDETENQPPTDQTDTDESVSNSVTNWQWNDPDGNLTYSDENQRWELNVPGASEENPLTQDALSSMLPTQITVTLSDGQQVVLDITWDLSSIPAEGVWEDELSITATINDPNYASLEGLSALQLALVLGEADTLASQDHLNANKVEGVTPKGTTINLFDYWLSSQNEGDNENPPNYSDARINAGHVLKFGKGMGEDNNTNLKRGNVNYWTGSKAVRKNIVGNTLTSGYPTLNKDILGGESLSYLFDPNVDSVGKASYSDVSGLLQVDQKTGYFYYDSEQNFAEFDESSNSFILYNQSAVNAAGSSPDGQFFPFNDGRDVFVDAGQNDISKANVISTDREINHYFGVGMTTRFIQQYDGYTDKDKNQRVTYEFSGDDDVWVFIDGVLVADLGGIHDKASLKIDFVSGNIFINESDDGTLKSKYIAAGKDKSTSWNGNTFADNTYHTLNFYYLERGNTDSNMSLQFNLVSIPESGVIKVDQAGNHIAGAGFALYQADENYEITNKRPICTGTTNENGELVFVDDQGMLISLADLHLNKNIDYMILRETTTPPGYRSSGDMKLRFETSANNKPVLLSSNQWETGSYASSKVTAQTGGQIKLANNSEQVDLDRGGTLFAVVLQRQDMRQPLDAKDNWKPVTGTPEKGWNIVEGGNNTLENIISAAQAQPYQFGITASGAYEANVENLPGDVTKYYYMLSDGNKNNAKYTIGYYYTAADSMSGANIDNTYRVNTEDIDRIFSVNLYIANIKNNLYVQKLDETGNPVSVDSSEKAATFALYNASDVTINNDGSYTITPNTQAIQTQQTNNMSTPLRLVGGAMFSKITDGEYYLIETNPPQGYKASNTAIHVVVDNTGVYADAGDADDGVSVRRGVGSVIKSMLQFAADDDVDSTLHDIKTELVSGSFDNNSFTWGNWDDNSKNDLHLQYENDNRVLEYGPIEDGQNAYFDVDSGWSKVLIRQCMNHRNSESNANITVLGDDDLTNLFSGSVTIRVENQSIGSLTIKKTVEEDPGTTENDNDEFHFTIEKTGGSAELNSTYPTKKNGQDLPDGVSFDEGKTEVILKAGETITINGLPDGTIFSVTEDEYDNYTTSNRVNDATDSKLDNKAEDLIISNDGAAIVEFINTYEPTATFAFRKTDANSTALSGASFGVYELVCTDSTHTEDDHNNDELVINNSGEITSVKNGENECWQKASTNTSKNTGTVSFDSLKTSSEYRLVEFKAPGGYSLPSGQWYLKYNSTVGRFEITGSTNTSGTQAFEKINGSEIEGIYYRVKNYKPGELPLTGSKGITLFLLAGSSLMLLGGIIYIIRRKRSVI